MKNPKITSERKQEVLKLVKTSFANIWSHPKGARGGKDCEDDQCEYCGKKVGGKTNTRFVHILTSGAILPNGVDGDLIDALWIKGEIKDQSQGAFALGSECAKKLLGKKIDEFSFKYSA